MGRPRLTEAQKILRGTAQPCRNRPETAQIDALAELPDPPAWVAASPAAAAEWERFGEILATQGVLNETLLTQLGHLCLAHADILAARAGGKVPTGQQQRSYAAMLKPFQSLARAAPTAGTPADNPFAKFKDPNHPWGPQ